MRGALVVALSLTLGSCAPGQRGKYPLVEKYNWGGKIDDQGENDPPLQKGLRTLISSRSGDVELPKSRVMGGSDSEVQLPKSRIIGGSEVRPNGIPWQAAIFSTSSFERIHCGGTIICPKFVLTAGHCFDQANGLDPKIYTIKAGEHDLASEKPTESVHKVKTITRHPDYKSFSGLYSANDLVIIELMEPIPMRKEAKALFLPSPSDTQFGPDTKFVVSGWGRMKAGITDAENGEPSPLLNVVTLPWIPEDDCKKAYKDPKKLENKEYQFGFDDSNICAGALGTGNIDACKGDSGGPLAWIDPNTEEVKLIGAVSWGWGCAGGDSPGVYAKITHYLDWINQIIGNCNSETCSAGNCVKKESLDRDIARKFRN